MNLLERLRRFGFKPKPIKTNPDTPQFYDQDLRLSFLEEQTAVNMINHWLAEHGREAKYPLGPMIFEEGNEQGIEPGIYSETNITPEEWDQHTMIGHAHAVILTLILNKNGILKEGQFAVWRVAPYRTREGYAILKAETHFS